MQNKILQYITASGLKKLKLKIKELAQKLNEKTEESSVAREHGDLSDNADFEGAINQTATIRGAMAPLQTILDDSVVIDYDLNSKLCQFGSFVLLKQTETGDKIHVRIVDQPDRLMDKGCKWESWIYSTEGRELIGKKEGETINNFYIEKISNNPIITN